MSASVLLLLCWAGLAGLSAAGVLLGNAGSGPLLAAGVLLVALVKAWLIAERFMELRHAPRLWRGLLLAWPLCLAVGILLSLQGLA